MAKVAKVPQVMQMEALECGAACLTMILAYYGKWVPLEKVRADCGVSRDGSKASNVLKAARSHGLAAKGMTYSVAALRRAAPYPCILFWNFSHFVVLAGFRRGKAVVNDPARGQVMIPMSEFEESFTGVALVFEPTDAFEPGGERPDPASYALDRLKGNGSAIAFVMLSAAITSLTAILSTSFGKVFVDQILTDKNIDWLIPLTVLMVAVALVGGLASIVNAIYLMRIQGKMAVVNSSRFMWHLLHLPMRFYEQRMVGDLQQRQTSNETIAFALIGQLAPVLVNLVMLLLYLVIMLRYSVLLTCVGLLTVLVNALLGRYISRKRVNVARSAAMNSGKLYATTIGGIEMIETIKASGAETGYFGRWAGYQAAVNESDARTARINAYLGFAPILAQEFANIAVLVLGIWLIVNQSFTPGALLAFQGFLGAFMAPVTQLITLGQTVQEMQTQMERVEDVMSFEPDVPEEETPSSEVTQTGGQKLGGAITVSGVTFGYSPLEPPLIEDLELTVRPGEWIALVGSSGSGKSTVGKLMAGLYDPWAGEIRYDGVPLREVPRSVLRSSLAVVDQDVVAFEDSVANNVKLWDNSIEDFEVILACRDADIHSVVVAREGGYESTVSPGGRNFSGGQLQRLEIARVLAQDPTIVILDEATSALDAQTEAEVIEHIRARGITCIVVAHRLSTIRSCDQILVLEEGKVVERGTHAELLAHGGAYAELVRSE